MKYEVVLDPKVVKFLSKLDTHTATSIRQRLKKLRDNPSRRLETVVGKTFLKFNIGSYRAFVDLDHKAKEVLVRHIGHRKNIYKR